METKNSNPIGHVKLSTNKFRGRSSSSSYSVGSQLWGRLTLQYLMTHCCKTRLPSNLVWEGYGWKRKTQTWTGYGRLLKIVGKNLFFFLFVLVLCGPLVIIHNVDQTCTAWLAAWIDWSLWLLAHELCWTCCCREAPRICAADSLVPCPFCWYVLDVHANMKSLRYVTSLSGK